MKRVLTIAIGIFLAYAAQASYLYWQVSNDLLNDANLKDVAAYASVIVQNGSDSPIALTSYYPTMDGISAGSQKVDVNSSDGQYTSQGYYYADLGEGNQYAGYTYWVELYNSNNQSIGKSTVFDNWSNAPIVADLTSVAQTMTAFSGSAYAVPEPTGAVLMIFGLAMLGLKRRKV